MGASKCSLRDLALLHPLRMLTRLVIGPRFALESRTTPGLPRSCTRIDSTFKRMLEGLSPDPNVGASLQVLEMHGPLEGVMREFLRNCKRLSWLKFGENRATVWQGSFPVLLFLLMYQ